MKKLSIFAAALCFVALASCDKGKDVNQPEQKGNVSITLFDSPSTRAEDGTTTPGEANESKITMVEIYVFDDAGTALDDKTKDGNGYIKLTSADLGTPAKWPYTTQVQMGAGTNKDVIVVANADLGAPTGTALNTFDKVMAAIATTKTVTNNAVMNNSISRRVPTGGFIMSGHVLDANVIAERSDNKIEVGIDRAVARIEYPAKGSTITFDLSEKELQDIYGETTTIKTTNGMTFDLLGYAVINGLKQTSIGFAGNNINDGTAGTAADVYYSIGYKPYSATGTAYNYTTGGAVTGTHYFPWNLWLESDNNKGTITVGQSETDRGGRIATNAQRVLDKIDTAWSGAYSGLATVGGNNTADWFIGSNDDFKNVYVYESEPNTKSDESYAGYDPDGVIAVMLKGQLTAGDGTAKTRYWRVNVRVADAYHIIRNSTYQTTINKIITPGYATPEEAEKGEEIVAKPGDTIAEFEITINPWVIRNVGDQI